MSKTKSLVKPLLTLFVVLLAALLLATPLLINANRYKPRLELLLSDRVGLPVSLAGNLGVHLAPGPALTEADIRIGNPPGFGDKDLLRRPECKPFYTGTVPHPGSK